MDDKLLRQAFCAFRNLFSEFVKMEPFLQAITISSISNKVFRNMFLKPDTVGIIPRWAAVWEIATLLRLFNGWPTLVWRGTLLMPVIGGRYIWLGLQMWKLMGTVKRQRKCLSILVVFGMGVLVYPIGTNPLATLKKHCWAGMRKQWRRFKTSGAGYVVSICCCEFRKPLLGNPCLENELCSHPYLKNSPIFGMSCTGVEPKSVRHGTVMQWEEIRYVEVISLFPYICKYGKFPVCHPEFTWVQPVPLTVWIARGLWRLRFCTKATPN